MWLIIWNIYYSTMFSCSWYIRWVYLYFRKNIQCPCDSLPNSDIHMSTEYGFAWRWFMHVIRRFLLPISGPCSSLGWYFIMIVSEIDFLCSQYLVSEVAWYLTTCEICNCTTIFRKNIITHLFLNHGIRMTAIIFYQIKKDAYYH